MNNRATILSVVLSVVSFITALIALAVALHRPSTAPSLPAPAPVAAVQTPTPAPKPLETPKPVLLEMTREELAKIPFRFVMLNNVNPPSIRVSFHNPFSDRRIEGVLIENTWFDEAKHQPVTVTQRIETVAPPLQVNAAQFFDVWTPAAFKPEKTTCHLKSVYYVPTSR